MATVATYSQTVADLVAFDLAKDTSPDREIAEQAYVARIFPALAQRAELEDELTWDELLSMPAAEAGELERMTRSEWASTPKGVS